MDFEKLAKEAKEFVDEHGGTDALKQEAEQLKDIASGGGTEADKLKQAGESLKGYLHNKE